MGENNQDYIRKHVDTIILRTLLESDSYGYDILKEIDTKSNGLYTIKQPTLYNSLKRLEKIGYISSYEGDISNGGKRRYYTLSDLGRKVLEQETAEWEFSRTLMSRLLSDKEYDLDNNPPPYNPSELRPITKRNVISSDNPASTNFTPVLTPIERASDSLARELTPQLIHNIDPKPIIEPKIRIENSYITESVVKPLNNYNTVIDSKSYNTSVDNKPKPNIDNYKNTLGYQLLYGEKPIEEIKTTLKNNESPIPKQQIDVIKPQQLSINDVVPNKISEPEKPKTQSYNYINYTNTIDDNSRTLAKQRLGLLPNDRKIEAKEVSIQQEKVLDERYNDEIQLSSKQNRKTRREVDPIQPRELRESEVFTNNVQYRPALDELFRDSGRNNDCTSINNDKSYESSASSYSFNSLQSKYKSEGIRLRPYSKTNTTTYYMSSFIYNNQINRDCVTIMYLLIVAQIFAIYFYADRIINLGFNSYLTFACGLILVPILLWIVYAINPNKRIKANFNFKVSILTSLMIFFNLLVIITLAGFFGFKADILIIESMLLPIFIPTVLIFNIPISSIVYALLYNSKQYHLR